MIYRIHINYFEGTSQEWQYTIVTVNNVNELYIFVNSDLPEGFRELVNTWDGDPITGFGSDYILAERVADVPVPNNAIKYSDSEEEEIPIRIVKIEKH